jgi:hypothetical protein
MQEVSVLDLSVSAGANSSILVLQFLTAQILYQEFYDAQAAFFFGFAHYVYRNVAKRSGIGLGVMRPIPIHLHDIESIIRYNC